VTVHDSRECVFDDEFPNEHADKKGLAVVAQNCEKFCVECFGDVDDKAWFVAFSDAKDAPDFKCVDRAGDDLFRHEFFDDAANGAMVRVGVLEAVGEYFAGLFSFDEVDDCLFFSVKILLEVSFA